MEKEIKIKEIPYGFNNPKIKRGDLIIDTENNAYLIGDYIGEVYSISLDSGEDSYTQPEIMPKHYKKLKIGDTIEITIK